MRSLLACLPAYLPSIRVFNMKGQYHPIRVQALTLLYHGVPASQVEAITGMSRQAIQWWSKKAKERGFNPDKDPRILTEYAEDTQRSGRPKIVSESVQQEAVDAVRKDRNGREKSCEILAFEVSISTTYVWRILQQHGFHSVKPTTKPGLTDEQRRKRLNFCLTLKDWTLDDFANIILLMKPLFL